MHGDLPPHRPRTATTTRSTIVTAASRRRSRRAATRRCTSHLFAGAKVVQLLDRYEAEYHIPNFDKAVDFGWFYFLTKPIFYALDWLYSVARQFRPGDPGVHRVRQGCCSSRSPTNPTAR